VEAPVKFEIVKSDNGKWFFRIVAQNGNVLAHSQQYTEKASAKSTIESIRKNAAGADIVDA